jgi:adenosylcobinamide kinase / adenosylcobinamide-phosphate guanylyltransferase
MSQPGIVLVLGGARSGKSDYAQRLAGRLAGRVLYVATATPEDDEMAARIARHRDGRPATWDTVEAPMAVTPAVREALRGHGAVLLDCLTMLASNVLLDDEALGTTALYPTQHPEAAEGRLLADLDALCDLCAERGTALVIVSNEVGMGVVPAYPLGRTYRDMLGRANQHVARRAERVLLLIAGIPVDVKALARDLPDPYRE